MSRQRKHTSRAASRRLFLESLRQESEALADIFDNTEPVRAPADQILRWVREGPRRSLSFVVTPEVAEKFLLYNTKNFRPLREKLVQKYVKALQDGHWWDNAVTIKFDTNAEGKHDPNSGLDLVLTDGQHRLSAVTRMGAGFETVLLLARCAPPEGVDQGAKRTAGNVFAREGFPNASIAAGIMLRALHWADGGPGRASSTEFDVEMLVEAAAANRARLDWAAANAAQSRHFARKVGPVPLGSVLFQFVHLHPEGAQVFANVLSGHVALKPSNALMRFREFLNQIPTDLRQKPSEVLIVHMAVRAWNDFLRDVHSGQGRKMRPSKPNANGVLVFPDLRSAPLPRARTAFKACLAEAADQAEGVQLQTLEKFGIQGTQHV